MSKHKFRLALFVAVVLIALFTVYYNFNPAEHRWMPRCPSKLITGLDCPACGVQRALHAALHGDIGAAWHFNPFLLIGLPYLLLATWGSCRTLPGNRQAHRISHHPLAAYGYIAIFFCWWIARNL